MAPSSVYAQVQANAASVGSKRKRGAVEEEGRTTTRRHQRPPTEDQSSHEDETVISSTQDEDQPSPGTTSHLVQAVSLLSKGKGRLDPGHDQGDWVAESNKRVFKQKTLVLTSRGVTHRMRHLTKDLYAILPHSKMDAKLDTKHQLSLLNELADLSNCSSALFFEARRHSDLYLWASLTPNGPSIRFHLLNAHTMDELKMTGNCLKGSRPVVVFDQSFDESPHWRLIKEVLMQVFAVPKTARRAKPFVDHVTSFSVADGKVWFRNYQIVNNAPLDLVATSMASDPESKQKKAKLSKNDEENLSMNEIGPRFVLVPVKIFEGSFGGAVVWENKDFVTPTAKLATAKLAKAAEYRGRKDAETERKGRREHLDSQEQSERERSGQAALEKRKVFAPLSTLGVASLAFRTLAALREAF